MLARLTYGLACNAGDLHADVLAEEVSDCLDQLPAVIAARRKDLGFRAATLMPSADAKGSLTALSDGVPGEGPHPLELVEAVTARHEGARGTICNQGASL